MENVDVANYKISSCGTGRGSSLLDEVSTTKELKGSGMRATWGCCPPVQNIVQRHGASRDTGPHKQSRSVCTALYLHVESAAIIE